MTHFCGSHGKIHMDRYAYVAMLILTIALAAWQGALPARADHLPTPVSRFLEQPRAQAWESVEELANSGQLRPEHLWIASVVRFADARIRRDLPNSHALVGIDPNEFRVAQDSIVKEVACSLARSPTQDLLPLLTVMACQEFDVELLRSAAELSLRISESTFKSLRVNVAACRSSNVPIVEEVAARIRPIL